MLVIELCPTAQPVTATSQPRPKRPSWDAPYRPTNLLARLKTETSGKRKPYERQFIDWILQVYDPVDVTIDDSDDHLRFCNYSIERHLNARKNIRHKSDAQQRRVDFRGFLPAMPKYMILAHTRGLISLHGTNRMP